MKITKGSLDDISLPASCTKTSSPVFSVPFSHVDRSFPTQPQSAVALTSDTTDMQDHSSSEEKMKNSSGRGPDKDQDHVDASDEEDEDSKLQKALDEIRRLDEILSAMMSREKEVKRQGKELREKMWQELQQNDPKLGSQSAHEAANTRLFLALEVRSGLKEEADVEPVFETELLDQEYDIGHTEQSDTQLDGTTELFEVDHEDTVQDQSEGNDCRASKATKKHTKNFVNKLVSSKGGQMLMTQAEKERLAMLLRDVEEEEDGSARDADDEAYMGAVWMVKGQGYTPNPSELEQLTEIDSRIRLLLSDEEHLSVQSFYTDLSMSQGYGSEASWELDGDPQPGEKVLQDVRERQEQERRLQEIEQQLETLDQGHEMTNESATLTEEQLHRLLEECERTQSRTQDFWTGDTTSQHSISDTDSPLLSEALLSQLLHDTYTTSFSGLESGTCQE
ncbi:fibrous sheath-interacting protein 1 [Myripristis murdjan]|uniref:fibrous sheath-interacting protein 1 n=1 Tax=Myripristis murdjan TaxID=586833 RepID=UPI001176165D|nr:fibrous sheath-interacting protein 1 [Myripristis murdjan]